MNSIKVVVRQIGVPHKGLNVQSAEEVSDYLETNLVSNGYVLKDTHYLGEVLNSERGVQGYKVMFVFVLGSVSVTGSDHTNLISGSDLVGEGVAPKKRGRPAKVEA